MKTKKIAFGMQKCLLLKLVVKAGLSESLMSARRAFDEARERRRCRLPLNLTRKRKMKFFALLVFAKWLIADRGQTDREEDLSRPSDGFVISHSRTRPEPDTE